mmetsp:Transcript_52058/g.158034  ORF Transcript_52058/g.158034 Transcript_52058/m.158034 type:complete len:256 (-) Transcript_52058:739-1506(-)
MERLSRPCRRPRLSPKPSSSALRTCPAQLASMSKRCSLPKALTRSEPTRARRWHTPRLSSTMQETNTSNSSKASWAPVGAIRPKIICRSLTLVASHCVTGGATGSPRRSNAIGLSAKPDASWKRTGCPRMASPISAMTQTRRRAESSGSKETTKPPSISFSTSGNLSISHSGSPVCHLGVPHVQWLNFRLPRPGFVKQSPHLPECSQVQRCEHRQRSSKSSVRLEGRHVQQSPQMLLCSFTAKQHSQYVRSRMSG